MLFEQFDFDWSATSKTPAIIGIIEFEKCGRFSSVDHCRTYIVSFPIFSYF